MPEPIEVLKDNSEQINNNPNETPSESSSEVSTTPQENIPLKKKELIEKEKETAVAVTQTQINLLTTKIDTENHVQTTEETSAEKLAADLEKVQNVVTDSIGSVYSAATENVVTPIVEKTNGLFLIGPLLGSFAEKFSPSRIKNTIAKSWYSFLASIYTTEEKPDENFWNPMRLFSGLAHDAREKLAFFDVEDAVEEHRAHKRKGEVLVFNEADVKREHIAALLNMTPAERKEKTATIIAQKRSTGEPTITITGEDLVRTQIQVASATPTTAKTTDAETKPAG